MRFVPFRPRIEAPFVFVIPESQNGEENEYVILILINIMFFIQSLQMQLSHSRCIEGIFKLSSSIHSILVEEMTIPGRVIQTNRTDELTIVFSRQI